MADMIIPWADVQSGDVALNDGSLVLVDEITVHPQDDEHPDFMVACVSGRHVLDDGTTGRRVHLDPPAAALTAVRRGRPHDSRALRGASGEWYDDWEVVDRDRDGNAVLRHRSTEGLYRILPVEEG